MPSTSWTVDRVLYAQVIGTVVATVKDPSLTGQRLLLIQPLTPEGEASKSPPLVAIDAVGVGVSERVLYVKGKEASFPFLPETVLADAGIVARVDTLSHRPVDPP